MDSWGWILTTYLGFLFQIHLAHIEVLFEPVRSSVHVYYPVGLIFTKVTTFQEQYFGEYNVIVTDGTKGPRNENKV